MKEWIRRKNVLEEEPEKARMFVRIYTVSPKKKELFALRFYFVFMIINFN